MTRERTCRACDGTGNRPMAWGLCWRAKGACSEHDCLVCLGSGRILEAITVQDALADADSYLRVAMGFPLSVLDKPLWAYRHSVRSGWYARMRASAAFRAVPGLRGK